MHSLSLFISLSFSVFAGVNKRHDEQEYTTENTNSSSWKIPILCSYYFFLSPSLLSIVLYCIVLCCILCTVVSCLVCVFIFYSLLFGFVFPLFLILCQVKMFSLSFFRSSLFYSQSLYHHHHHHHHHLNQSLSTCPTSDVYIMSFSAAVDSLVRVSR